MKNSILDVRVSCFAHCKSTLPTEVNLLDWITSEKHRCKVEQIRSEQDATVQKDLKMTLPAITPSGIFSQRDTKHLVAHSGFLAFDIDFQDNCHIRNYDDLKGQISHISSVAYCGLSVRGNGYWGLVPIPVSTPEEHRKRFTALAHSFAEFGINLDQSGADVTRLRIYSWDPDAYINHQAQLFTRINTLRMEGVSAPRPVQSKIRVKVESVISQIQERKIDITEDYDNWYRIGAALANEFGEPGRHYFHAVSRFHPEYDPTKTDKKFDDCLRGRVSGIGIGTFFHMAEQFGVSQSINKHSYPGLQKSYSTGNQCDIVSVTPFLSVQPVKVDLSEPISKRRQVEIVIDKIVERQVDITEPFDDWITIGAALSKEFGENGRDYFHALSQFHPWYSPRTTNYVFDCCLRGDYGPGNMVDYFRIASQYELTIDRITVEQQSTVEVELPP